jgi:hypothetical protein
VEKQGFDGCRHHDSKDGSERRILEMVDNEMTVNDDIDEYWPPSLTFGWCRRPR